MGGTPSTVEAFRRLWDAYGRGRHEEILELLDDGCELRVSRSDDVRRGHGAVRALLDELERRYKSVTLTCHATEPVGAQHLVVLGHLTAFDHDGVRALDEPIACVVRFLDGRVLSATTCGDPGQARATATAEARPNGR